MAICSETPTSAERGESARNIETGNGCARLRIRPSPGKVAVLAVHASRFPRASGLLIPSTSDNARWLGWVFGIGEGVESVEWGDLVEISRWTGVQWFTRPLRTMTGEPSPDVDYLLPDGAGRRAIVANGRDMWAFLEPRHMLYRLNDFAGAMAGTDFTVGPLFDRVLVKHERKAGASAGGVKLLEDWYRAYGRLARIVAKGPKVEELEIGDWVLIDSQEGCHLAIDGEPHSIVRERHVILNFGADKPKEVE